MLIGNYSIHHKCPIRWMGGSMLSPEVQARSNYSRPGSVKNFSYKDGQTTVPSLAFPHGYYPPYCYRLPQYIVGSVARLTGEGTVTATLTNQIGAMEAALTGEGTITAFGAAGGVDYALLIKEVWQLHGLDAANPMTVTATSRTVGGVAQTIAGDTTVVVTRT